MPLNESGGLEHMGQDEAQTVLAMREDFTLSAAMDEPARLEVRCRHSAWRADQLRNALASNGRLHDAGLAFWPTGDRGDAAVQIPEILARQDG